jgi:dihydroneopterin aldolase
MNAKLSIQGLKLTTTIGAYPWEQHIEQTILVDVDLWLDITKAAESDDLTHALDYAALAQLLQETVKGQKYKLLEALAAFLNKQIIKYYPQITAGKLTVHKPGALVNAKDVAVEVSW